MKKTRIFIVIFFLLGAGFINKANAAWEWPLQAKTPKQAPKQKQAKDSYRDLVRRNLQLRRELGELEKKFTPLGDERNVLIMRIKELQKEKDNLAQSIQGLKTASSEFPELKAKITAVSQRLDAVVKDRDRLQRKFEDSQERLAGLDEAVLKEVQKRSEETKTERTSVFRILQGEKARLTDEMKDLTVIFARDKKDLELKIETIEHKNKELKHSNKELENELKSARALFQDREDKLQAEVRQLQRENKGLEKDLKKLAEEKQRCDEKLKSCKAAVRRAETEVRKLEKRFKMQSSRTITQEKEIKILKADKRRYKVDMKLGRRAHQAAEIKKERLEKKMKELKKKTEKERMDMHYNLAVIFDKNGMYEDAEREYLLCLKVFPKDADVHYNLGILYDDKLKNNNKGMYYYKKFLEFHPMGENSVQVKEWLLHAEQEQRMGSELR